MPEHLTWEHVATVLFLTVFCSGILWAVLSLFRKWLGHQQPEPCPEPSTEKADHRFRKLIGIAQESLARNQALARYIRDTLEDDTTPPRLKLGTCKDCLGRKETYWCPKCNKQYSGSQPETCLDCPEARPEPEPCDGCYETGIDFTSLKGWA